MANYTQDQIYQIMIQAGWPSALATIGSKIGILESNGDAAVIRICPSPKCGAQIKPEYSVGLFQINILAHPEYGIDWLKNPVNNAKAAYDVYLKQGWNAWKNSYQKYLQGGGVDISNGLTIPVIGNTINSAIDSIFGHPPTVEQRFNPYLNAKDSNPVLRTQIAIVIAIIILIAIYSY